jgi:hypothetical protein
MHPEGRLELGIAQPCAHCRALLCSVSNYRRRKHGQQLRVRYTDAEGKLTAPVQAAALPDGKLSKWYRGVYRKRRDRV